MQEASNNELVLLYLVDFCESDWTIKLKQQFSDKKKAFSMKFKLTQIIGEQPNCCEIDKEIVKINFGIELNFPSDIKIAKNHHCLAISDSDNNRILFLNLETFSLLTEFSVEYNIVDLHIEEDDYGSEFIYFDAADTIYKFNLDEILKHPQINLREVKPIWKIEESLYGSLAIIKDSELNYEKVLLKWNNGGIINVNRDLDGSFVRNIALEKPLNTGLRLFAKSDNELFVLGSKNVYLVSLVNGKCNECKVSQPWGYPVSLASDLKGGRHFVSDNQGLVILNGQGQQISFFSPFQGFNPSAIAYNDNTGKLYIMDRTSFAIYVYE